MSMLQRKSSHRSHRLQTTECPDDTHSQTSESASSLIGDTVPGDSWGGALQHLPDVAVGLQERNDREDGDKQAPRAVVLGGS
jgi:hypothetical protein